MRVPWHPGVSKYPTFDPVAKPSTLAAYLRGWAGPTAMQRGLIGKMVRLAHGKMPRAFGGDPVDTLPEHLWVAPFPEHRALLSVGPSEWNG